MMLRLTQGDTAPTLTGWCGDKTARANLTGATAVVHIQRADGTVVSRAATITSPTLGEWSLPLVAGDLNQQGGYKVEVEVTYSNGKVQTFYYDNAGKGAQLLVRPQLA